VARSQLTGTAGEYFVAAELSMQGWLATVTIKNSPGVDILAKHPTSGQSAAIQVKTTSKVSGRFILSAKDETTAIGNDEWYAFVVLGAPNQRPRFYIVPRDVVAGYIYSRYHQWQSQPDRQGKPRKHIPTRDVNAAELGAYEDNWKLLEKPASEAAFLGTEVWVGLARRWPRQEGYPGFPPEAIAA
jgi:hypothetical protein